MKLEIQTYEVTKIVNVHKHVDGPWFWDKYSAHPYIGCRYGCEFCYARGGKHGATDKTFDTRIRAKVNAADLLRKELAKLSPDVLACGDWQQPVEARLKLSRAMLEVVLDASFPLLVIERSPLVTRDLDLLTDINRVAWVGVIFSISSLDPALKQAFEPHSPGVRLRLRAMARLAGAGLQVGTALMPVLPMVGDDGAQFEAVVRATKDHGGSFVLVGGLSMEGAQAQRTLAAAQRVAPDSEPYYRKLYRWSPGGKPRYSPPRAYTAELGLRVRELCTRYGLRDRMPRYIAPGPLAVNKRIAERLFLKTYELDLEQAKTYRIWAYRKAAWTVDELSENIADLYAKGGEAGLRALPNIGKSMARRLARWLEE